MSDKEFDSNILEKKKDKDSFLNYQDLFLSNS